MRPVESLDRLVRELRDQRGLLGVAELEARRPARLSSGFEALDDLLGGGFPFGRLVEVVGAQGTAGSALIHRVVALATAEGWPCALVDPSEAFDPRTGASAGIELERLLWCRPKHLDQALRAVDVILGSGAFRVVALDMGESPASANAGPRRPRAPSSAAWVRLARRAEAVRACLLVLSSAHRPGPEHSALALSAVARPRFIGAGPGRRFAGLEVTVRLERNRLGLPPGSAELVLRAPRRAGPGDRAEVEAPPVKARSRPRRAS